MICSVFAAARSESSMGAVKFGLRAGPQIKLPEIDGPDWSPQRKPGKSVDSLLALRASIVLLSKERYSAVRALG
jgi:hypothetical protein